MRSTRSLVKTLCPVLVAVTSLAGCSADPDDGGTSNDGQYGNEAGDAQDDWTYAELHELAWRYLYEVQPDKAKRDEVRDVITLMSPGVSERFFGEVRQIQLDKVGSPEGDEGQAAAIDADEALTRYARASGFGRLSLSLDQVAEAVGATSLRERLDEGSGLSSASAGSTDAVTKAICLPPYVSCSTATFSGTNYGASCGSGCTTGFAFDRSSNSACELLACDYRVFYATGSAKSRVDGKTAAADCVINYYGGIISNYQSGNMQLGYGVGGPTACGIITGVGSYLQSNTQVF